MSNYKFEGDVNSISETQKDFIIKVLQKRGFCNAKVQIEVVGQAGDNYAANVKRITAENDGNILKMIAKVAPTQEGLRAAANIVSMFSNEHVMYTEVLPKFTEYEEAANVPQDERLRYAKCYGSLQEPPNEIILLEDLKESDFIMLNRFESLKDDAVKLVLKSFASLHALSYVLKNKEPETYTAIKNKLYNIWLLVGRSPQMGLYLSQMENDVMSVVDEKYKKYIRNSITEITPLCEKTVKADSQLKFSVIQQGDSWTNNIMFQIKDDKAVGCCMIDYQASKESSPVADIHYMIFSGTDYETRSKNFHEWIDYYHNELDRAMTNFDLKVALIFPREQLDSELRRNAKLSLVVAFMLAGVTLREKDEAEKIKEAMENDVLSNEELMEDVLKSMSIANGGNEKMFANFKTKVEGILDSFIELGYL